MLNQIDLNKKMPKASWREIQKKLQVRLAELQRTVKTLKTPVLIIIEGWDASGKGTLLNRILQPLDPRGFRVYNVSRSSDEEKLRPYLWRFWSLTPPEGQIVFMNRSWYRRLLEGRFEGLVKGARVEENFEETRNFERQLRLGGTQLVKFFIHISQKEQAKRLEALDKKATTTWRVNSEEWNRNKRYNELSKLTEEMLHSTDIGEAAWTIVNGHDLYYAEVQMLSAIVKALEEAVIEKEVKTSKQQLTSEKTVKEGSSEAQEALGSLLLKDIDLNLSISESRYKKELPELQERLREIQYTLYRERIPAVIAFEGWDAAGKGGAIKRLTEQLDPRGYEVHPTAAPNDIERAHYYLWRFWKEFPKAGHMAVFDRTWYGRVLVERVEGFCSPEEWRRAYSEINDMEAQWIQYGTILVKFWMEISPEEQLLRFQERENSLEKNWKITEEDWRNREKWPQYQSALDEMLLRTSTLHAPWTVVEANNKEYARIKVLKTVIKASEDFFKARGIK